MVVVFYLLGRFIIQAIPQNTSNPTAILAKVVLPWLPGILFVAWILAEFTKFTNRRRLGGVGKVADIRAMDWREFEKLVGEAYRRQGFTVRETPDGPDGGYDLILSRGGEKTLVQCKRWRTWKVDVKAVREFYGVMASEGAARGIFVSTGRYTADAHAFVKDKQLELIDGEALVRMIDEIRKTRDSTTPGSDGTQSERTIDTPPLCPRCGAPMILRMAKRGFNAGTQFFGCSKYPSCRGKRPQNPVAAS